MKNIFSILVICVSVTLSFAQTPLALHPDNHHYFTFGKQPVIMISSAEHYGALINTEVDYKK